MEEEKIFYEYNSSFLPKLRLADTEIIEPPYIHRKRMPMEYIIYLVKSGEMYLEEDGVLYHLLPGDFLLLDPDKVHVGKRATRCEYFYIHFQYAHMQRKKMTAQQMCERMMEQRIQSLRSDACGMSAEEYQERSVIGLPKYMHLDMDTGFPQILELVHTCVGAYKNHLEGYKTLGGCQLMEILLQVSRQYLSMEIQGKSGSVKYYRKIYDLLNYLNTSYQEPICGDLIEDIFESNFDYLNRVFRQNMGKTIFRYLAEVRIARAKEMITTSSMKISQVSEKVGFADEGYFSKVFKKYTGMTPLDYRKAV